MLEYDTLAANDAVLGVANQEALSPTLQKIVKNLGYTEAVYLSKQGESFNAMMVFRCAPHTSTLSRAIEQYQITLESCRVRYRQTLQNCWSQTILVEQELDSIKTTQSYLVQCCYTQATVQSHVLLCLTALDSIDNKTLLRHAPFLLHLNHLLSQKMESLLAPASESIVGINSTPCPLSARELAVLRWTADGKTADEIAAVFCITARTVNFHIANIMNLLIVPNKTAAVAKAIMKGWLF